MIFGGKMKVTLSHLTETTDPIRNKVQFLLSVDADLRAKEVAAFEWRMILDAERELTDAIRLGDKSTKGKSGGIVYISTRLKEALADLLVINCLIGTILKTKSGKSFSAASMTKWFWLLYKDLGFEDCSSHSGRRMAITKWARTISEVGGSMRDVQAPARHSSLQQTQKYIDVSPDATRKVVG